MTINGQQVKAARRLLGWSQEKLAGEAGISTTPVGDFEVGRRRPSVLVISTIERALKTAGVEFGEGEAGATLKAKS